MPSFNARGNFKTKRVAPSLPKTNTLSFCPRQQQKTACSSSSFSPRIRITSRPIPSPYLTQTPHLFPTTKSILVAGDPKIKAKNMCRSSHFQGPLPRRSRNTLNMKAFFVRFSGLKSRNSLPDSLTLLFLPRINGAELLIDGSKVRPDSSAFLTLHRVVNVKSKAGEAIFGSRSRVSSSGGVRFEVFTRDYKVLEGIFRKDDEEEWRLECECGLECEEHGGAAAEVCVAVEGKGYAALNGRVEMAMKKKTSRRGKIDRLEVIPEENEAADDDFEYCSCDSGEDCGPSWDMMDMDMDMDGVGWAVDLGVWVMCLGMGYLVSKASARSLRRLRLF